MLLKRSISAIFILTNASKNIFTRYLYESTHIPDIIERFYLQIFILAISCILYLRNKKKTYETVELMIGVLFGSILELQSQESTIFGFKYSLQLQMVIELLGMVVIIFVTEILSGRKPKTESNSLIVFTFSVIVACFEILNVKNFDFLAILTVVFFCRSVVFNFVKHVYFVSQDFSKVMLIPSSVILMKSTYEFSTIQNLEFHKMNSEIVQNPYSFSILFLIMIVNFFSDLYVFKYFDIDIIFLFKTISTIICILWSKIWELENKN